MQAPTSKTAYLIELCQKYNRVNPELAIDLEKYTTEKELIFCLWERQIFSDKFGFGQPYDEALQGYSQEYDLEDEDLERRLYGLETHSVYQSYLHPDMVSNFLYDALDLPLVSSISIATLTENLKEYRSYFGKDVSEYPEHVFDNINKFNDFWCKLVKKPIKDYNELRQILVSSELTNLDLCYLLWECENYGIFKKGITVWTVIEEIKKM